MEKATLANGCFWCTEAIFRRLKGVHSVVSGYTGGTIVNPTYDQVSSGNTGHAEALQIAFDPKIISFETLLEIFFATHNPTTLNRQGADVGTQYRSAIFYHSPEQQKVAEKVKQKLDTSGKYKDPIVTEIVPFSAFYTAESYHQEYYEKNRSYPYCTVVIDPKVRKLLTEFSQNVKDEYREV